MLCKGIQLQLRIHEMIRKILIPNSNHLYVLGINLSNKCINYTVVWKILFRRNTNTIYFKLFKRSHKGKNHINVINVRQFLLNVTN